MNICFSISIAQHGEIIIIINSSPWSQNLSLRVRVNRVTVLRVRVLKSHCSYCSWPTIASIDFWSCFWLWRTHVYRLYCNITQLFVFMKTFIWSLHSILDNSNFYNFQKMYLPKRNNDFSLSHSVLSSSWPWPWPTWSLTNLVLDLANLVTNLDKPSLG